MRASDPDLAETALNHAVAKGLTPDQLIDGVGVEIAFQRRRQCHGTRFCLEALWSCIRHNANSLQSRVVLSRGDRQLQIGRRGRDSPRLSRRDRADADTLEHLARLHRAWPDRERLLPPPSVQVENLPQIDLTPILEAQAASTERNNYLNARD